MSGRLTNRMPGRLTNQTKSFGFQTSFEIKTVWQPNQIWKCRNPNVRILDDVDCTYQRFENFFVQLSQLGIFKVEKYILLKCLWITLKCVAKYFRKYIQMKNCIFKEWTIFQLVCNLIIPVLYMCCFFFSMQQIGANVFKIGYVIYKKF